VYVEELQRWSKVADLVSQANAETVICKHILDSLAVSPLVPLNSRLLDLGSGAGFPGLALAIIEPRRKVALIEARRKRVSFLKEIVRKTETANVTVHEGRAELLAAEESLRASFDVVITRATWSLEELLRLAHVFVASGGIAVAMKGSQVEKELHNILYPIGFRLQSSHDYTLPFGKEKRRVLIFAQECST